MSEITNYEYYLGTCAGSILQYSPNKARRIKHYFRKKNFSEISALSWGKADNEILIGFRNGKIRVFNLLSEECTTEIPLVEKVPIVGLVTCNDDIYIATKAGTVNNWTPNGYRRFVENSTGDKTIEKMVGDPFNPVRIALGGYRNEIKIFNLNSKEMVFQGKGDRHDALDLAQPSTVNDITFFKPSSGLDIGTVTKEGQIRIYDARAQRRPVKVYKNERGIYTCISSTSVDHQVVVGSNTGYVQIMDLRKQIKPLKTFKGYMGGISDLCCDYAAPIVASCSLDRYFRIHNIEKETTEYDVYSKIQTTCILMKKPDSVTRNGKEEGNEDIVMDIKEKPCEDMCQTGGKRPKEARRKQLKKPKF